MRNDDIDDAGDSGQGGKSGAINFHYEDALLKPLRDDQLSPSEQRRLLMIKSDTLKIRVDAQKNKLKQREALKSGKTVYAGPAARNNLGAGRGAGSSSKFPPNPVLAQAAQFSGMVDSQVNFDINKNQADINEDKQNENDLRNTHRLQNMPKFAPPKPRPY
jgi:hypothetical protein